MAGMMRKALVVGGAGALGSSVVSRLAGAGWKVASLDLRAAAGAHESLLVADGADVVEQVRAWSPELHAVVHVAGGFGMGAIADGPGPMEAMWKMNAVSAFTAAHVASLLLTDPGLLVLTGANAVKSGPVPFAAGYSMSKAATHQLAIDFCADTQGSGRRVACILPGTIDTPANRESMPDVDRAGWTAPDAIATRILEMCEAPQSVGGDDPFVQV